MNALPDQAVIERFWAHVDKSGDCWIWTAARDKSNYGKCNLNGRTRLAHRAAYELTHGSIPDGMQVLHRCDNPPCVNPDHLFLGTHTDNMADMWRKGRGPKNKGRNWPRHLEAVRRGEQHGMAKLTSAQVVELRRRYAAGNIGYGQLAREYGITKTNVIAIIRHKTWKTAA